MLLLTCISICVTHVIIVCPMSCSGSMMMIDEIEYLFLVEEKTRRWSDEFGLEIRTGRRPSMSDRSEEGEKDLWCSGI